jgi:hypothetical protein
MADTILKVTFIDLEVTRDGDPVGRGELYWSFKVDGSVVSTRSSANPLTIGSGGSIALGDTATVTKSGAVGSNLMVSGTLSEKDVGKDESDTFSNSFSSIDNYGTGNPHPVRFTDNNLDVTLHYAVELA